MNQLKCVPSNKRCDHTTQPFACGKCYAELEEALQEITRVRVGDYYGTAAGNLNAALRRTQTLARKALDHDN